VTRAAQLLLGHGASGTAASMRPWVDALAAHDVDAVALDLPKSNADRAMDVYRTALADHPGAGVGGHSYGGRVASLLAAEEQVSCLVLLSYPLHRPGHPEEVRTEHWARISCPVLVLSGERDPFARVDLLRAQVRRLREAELVTWPRLGHGLVPVVEEAAERVAGFVRRVVSGAPATG
jgi:predicted alpha/beta-hydrolase family hydrolase